MKKEKHMDQLLEEIDKAFSKVKEASSKIIPDYRELMRLRIEEHKIMGEIKSEIKSKGADEKLCCKLYMLILKDYEITSRVFSSGEEFESEYTKVVGYLSELAVLKQFSEKLKEKSSKTRQYYEEWKLSHKKIALDNQQVNKLLDELLKGFDPAKFSVLTEYHKEDLD